MKRPGQEPKVRFQGNKRWETLSAQWLFSEKWLNILTNEILYYLKVIPCDCFNTAGTDGTDGAEHMSQQAVIANPF